MWEKPKKPDLVQSTPSKSLDKSENSNRFFNNFSPDKLKDNERGNNVVCKKCGSIKSVDDFSLRDKRTGRRDKTCKECRKKERKKREKNNTAQAVDYKTKSSTRSRNKGEFNSHRPAPARPVHPYNFQPWSNAYGRELNASEKAEIYSNVVELATVLAEIHNEQTGEIVFIPKS